MKTGILKRCHPAGKILCRVGQKNHFIKRGLKFYSGIIADTHPLDAPLKEFIHNGFALGSLIFYANFYGLFLLLSGNHFLNDMPINVMRNIQYE